MQTTDEATLPGLIAQALARGFDLTRELPLRAHLYALGAQKVGAQEIGGQKIGAQEIGASQPDAVQAGARDIGRSGSLASESDAADQHVLVLLLHHIAGDGWSLGPLSRDLGAFYRARCAGARQRHAYQQGQEYQQESDQGHEDRPPQSDAAAVAAAAGLPSLPVQYADYTLWQRQVLGEESEASSALSRQLSYWTAALADLPEQIELPADRARPAVSSHRGGGVELRIGPDLHRGLAGLARQSGASLFMVLQAGLAGLLSRLGAGTDIAIGSPIAGRSDAALDDLVGFFVNTLVLRTDVSGNPSVSELIGRVRGSNLAAYAHAELPFERLVEVINPARSLSRHPLFQVMLAFETETAGQAPGLELVGLGVAPQPLTIASAKFDLSVALRERRAADGTPAGIEGVLEYASDLFDEASIATLGQRLLRLLEGAVADPARALGSIDILEAAERDTILRAWNDTTHDLARDIALPPGDAAAGEALAAGETAAAATLPALFAAQAARTPDAIAVVSGQRTLSYAALDAHANRLAHHLQGIGRRARDHRRAVRRALARDGDRPPRHPQGRRRLPAARSELSARAARLHAGRRAVPPCW